MTAAIVFGHKRFDAMIAESEFSPADLGLSEELIFDAAPTEAGEVVVYTFGSLIRLLKVLGATQ